MPEVSKIAIIGMACIFPGAKNLDTYFENLKSGYDAITDVPGNRWEDVFYDPESKDYDRFYCRRGGFIDEYAMFDPFYFGIMPVAAEEVEPDQLLTLKVSHDALMDAGYDMADVPGKRTGIIIGKGNYSGAGRLRLDQHVKTAQQLITSIKSLIPNISAEDLRRIKADFQSKIGRFGPDTAIGLVPNLTASRVANRLDFKGPAYTIDAACASSLIALDQASKALQLHECDLMLAGGVHLCQDESFWSVFTQLGVLSRSGKIKPFDKNADGVLIGEGVGVVVLKRYEDAIRDNDRIYSVIQGIGVSSDGKSTSLMLPDVQGQISALEKAWRMSGLRPEHIGYIEGHGTGAPAGDTSELKTLSRFFTHLPETGKKPGLGSVKSMIGHCMPAAGIAGIIKTSLSLYHKKKFPSLNCSSPNTAVNNTEFRVLDKLENWDVEGIQRIAGVNAFGFGGINAHVVMSEHEQDKPVGSLNTSAESETEHVLMISAQSQHELLAALEKEQSVLSGGTHRLVVFGPNEKKLEKARKIIKIGSPWRGRGDIYYSPDGLFTKGGKIAFLFPGVDNLFDPKLEDIAAFLNKPMPDYASNLKGLGETGVDIIRTNQFFYEVLTELGITPDMVAGHSIGEWSGMIATGIVDLKELDEFIKSFEENALQLADVAFAAAGCSISIAESFIADIDEICVSNDNCPHQVILCGKDASIDLTISAMKKKGILCQKLSFRSGFHSPLFASHLNSHRKNMEQFAFGSMKTPLWSATTCRPYPSDIQALKRLIIDHLIQPVRFRELILKLYQEGARIFIQIGTGRLSGFVQDTLKGKAFSAIDTNISKRTGMQQIHRALASCFIEGIEANFSATGMVGNQSIDTSNVKTNEIRLKLGAPIIHLEKSLNVSYKGNPVPSDVPNKNSHPVLRAYNDAMGKIALMQNEILEGWELRPDKSEEKKPSTKNERNLPIKKTKFEMELSLDKCPWLIDHSLYPQHESCTNIYEKFPVVPMTMSIDILCEYALKMAPDKKVVSIEKIQAFKWMDVCDPRKLEIEVEPIALEKFKITIKDYVTGIVSVSANYPLAPSIEKHDYKNKIAPPITAEQLYKDRWMFHGPAYQGVKKINSIADNAIDGVIASNIGRGSLLDNAGQLFGYWVMIMGETDKLAMPMKIGKIDFFSDHPTSDENVECRVKCYSLKKDTTTSDMSLSVAGQPWATITYWENKRFEIDNNLFSVLTHPGTSMLSKVEDDHILIYRDVNKTASATDFLSRRYCTEFEKKLYDRIAPREKRRWLNSLIVIKDAVRYALFSQDVLPVYQNEISLKNYGLKEKCEAVGPLGRIFEVAFACQGEWGAAVVTSYETATGNSIILPKTSDGELNDRLISLILKKNNRSFF